MLTEQDHINHSGHQLTTREQQILFSPFRLVVVLVLCIFVAELLVMIILHSMPTLPAATKFLLDALLLNIVLSPVLVFLLLRPLKHLIVSFQFNEKRLQHRKEDLKKEVQARTSALDAVVEQLREEISEHEKVKKVLNENKDMLETIIESISSPLFYKDVNGHYLGCNSAFSNYLGIPKEKIIGSSVFDISPEELAEIYHRADLDLLESGGSQTYEAKVRYADGALHEIVFNKSVILHQDGRVGGLVGVMLDITKLKQVEESLHKFSQVVEQSPLPVIITDTSGSIEYVNPRFSEVTGYSIPEIIDQNPRIMNSGETSSELYRNLWETITKGGTWQGVLRNRKKNGELFWETATISSLKNREGEIIKYFAIKEDITARKNLEDQLQQAQKIESIGNLAGGVAHDFNNMLGVILGHTELAIRKADPASPLISDLEEIRTAANRSANLTRQLLTFARKQVITPKVLDLNESISGTIKILERLIGENIQLSWNPASNLWPVKVDPTQVDQILANLCVNARDAIAGIGKISIKTANTSWDEDAIASHPYDVVSGDYALLSVSDDGCGMDKEAQTHIFEPFYTTKEVGSGTGLGLATVYGAVKQNHGFLAVYSEPGQGTVFNIYFPREKATVEVVAETAEKTLLRGTETVLLVEDDEMLLRLVTSMLEESGYTVLAAATTALAQTLAEEHPGPIHLLISDVIMPAMNGKELSEKLLPLRPEMKVLFLSGYTADIISSQGVIEDEIHFLQKPFSLETLTAKVRELLDDH